MTKDEFTELFAMQVRGSVATAFVHSRAEICDEHWQMLRGEKEFTMRDLGEIGHLTGVNPHLVLRQLPEREKNHD